MFTKISRPTINLILVLISLILFQSCVSWDDKAEPTTIQTDIRVHIIVQDFISGNLVPNQQVNWSLHLYNISTDTESDQKTGQLLTDSNGEADIPMYQCQLNPNYIVRIIAQTPDQTNDQINPMTVRYSDAQGAANDDLYAEIPLIYTIVK